MRKTFLFLISAILVIGLSGVAQAQTVVLPANITLKQGILYGWRDQTLKNLTTLETAKTRAVDSWGKWNILWDGWCLDAGFAYDGSSLNTAALLLGREFGTLGKYLPIDFPLKDKINITIYPVALRADNLFAHPTFSGASGGGFVKLNIQF